MKKVKLLLIVGILFLFCGCSKVKDLSLDDIMNTINSYSVKANVYRTGYKYYLPRGLSISDSTEFNEIITNGKEDFYLFVDAVSFNKKIKKDYEENKTSYYSKKINYNDKFGYLEINLQENGKYFIEIMYNYAKIEVIVDEVRINSTLLNCLNILKSIDYNEDIVANLFDNNVLNYTEEEFNIFNTTSNDSTYLQLDDSYEEEEIDTSIPDTDLIN